jgi:hypothetical protein
VLDKGREPSTVAPAINAHKKEDHMIAHVISSHYDTQVKVVQGWTKVDKADTYNGHFKYKAGDPGFIVATTDIRGGVWKKCAK